MKTTTIIALLILSFSFSAQEEKIRNRFTAGFQIGQLQKDFALGVNFTSPFFAHESVGVRLRANLAFYEHETPQQIITWTPYSNVSLGVVGIGGIISERIRLYGEGGVVCILPSSAFSSEDFSVGGYGLFGFEFYMESFVNYFIEIGGIGAGAIADKIQNKPIYSNGLLIHAGFRFAL